MGERFEEFEVSGLRMRWSEAGEGPAVLCLHSSGLSGRQWRRLAAQLEGRFRVVLPDLLGHGSSMAWPEGEPFGLEQDLVALRALCARVGPGAHLVGHSYGGLLALLLALEDPARARSLSLFEPVAFGVLDPAKDAAAREELRRVEGPYVRPEGGGPDRAWLRGFVDWWQGEGAWDGLQPAARAGFEQSGWALSQGVLSLLGLKLELDSLRRLAAPTLLLGGALSPQPAQRVLERLEALLPSARRVLFEGAGHLGPLTHAVSVNEAIARHLDGAW